MKTFKSKSSAVELLRSNGIICENDEVLYPKDKEFEDEVHEAIDFLIEDCDFGICYVLNSF